LYSVLAVGAATISDIYRLEERGTAMGIFFGVGLMKVLTSFIDDIHIRQFFLVPHLLR